MTNATATRDSLALRSEIDSLLQELRLLRQSWHTITESDDYGLSYASLNQAYGDDEPEYGETDLIWKNPNYVPPR